MKHIITLLLCAAALPASAQSYDYLTFQKVSGEQTSLTSDNLKITFEGDNIVATNGTATYTAALSEMAQMFFSSEATGIKSAHASEAGTLRAAIVNGHLTTNAPAGSSVSVISLDGRLLNANAPLGKGTYLVRINNTTLKVVAQ